MTLYTVTLTGDATPYEVYGGIDACDHYLLGAVGAGAAAYRALASGSDARKRLLIGGTRWVDQILAAGTPTGGGGTALQVPLEDVVNADGSAMSDGDQLAIASRAAFEAAAILALDQDAVAAVDTGSNIRKLDADGTSIEFFRPTSALDGTAPTLPLILARLLAPLIAAATGGSVVVVGGSAHGTCRTSSFDDCDRFERTEPF